MNLLRILATVSSLTMVSRVLGFVRDFLIARIFGAGLLTDAFFVAFKIPNLLRRLFAEGVLAGLRADSRRVQELDGAEDTKTLIDSIATVLFLALVLAAALGMAAAPIIVYVTAPGFAAEPEKFALTVQMLRITFPYIVFISLVALSAGILNTWNKFSVPAVTPTLLNVAFIVGALFFADWFDPPVLVLAGRCSSVALQLAYRWSVPRPARAAAALAARSVASRLRRVLLLMLPAAGAVGRPDLDPAQPDLRLLSTDRQHLVALLRRPPDGAARGRARRRGRHDPAAEPVEVPRHRQSRPSTAGCSTGDCASRCCSPCRPPWRWCWPCRW